MDKQIQKLDSFSIALSIQKICVRMGYRISSEHISPSVIASIEEAKERANSLLDPKAIYRILDSAEINRHPIFTNAEKVALCICTIGPQIEIQSAAFMKNYELIKGLILDAMGSEAVEQVARQTDRLLSEKSREMGLWPSKRFSPGYKSWDIEGQRYVFRMLPAEVIGVTLNESCMMIPRKSVSFRINFYRTKDLTTRSIR
ncbi:MAG: vitamin B12 dependent-methionine synthase activation domain-containing protein [Candidatus Aminicenantes bacterium]